MTLFRCETAFKNRGTSFSEDQVDIEVYIGEGVSSEETLPLVPDYLAWVDVSCFSEGR